MTKNPNPSIKDSTTMDVDKIEMPPKDAQKLAEITAADKKEKRKDIAVFAVCIVILLMLVWYNADSCYVAYKRHTFKKSINALCARGDSLRRIQATLKGWESSGTTISPEIHSQIDTELRQNDADIAATRDSMVTQKLLIEKLIRTK